LESLRHPETDKRERQFDVEGGVGELEDGIGKRNAIFGRRNGKPVEVFNFLPNAIPSLTSKCGELPQLSIDFVL